MWIGDFFCSLICVSSILRRSGRCAAEILIFFWGGVNLKEIGEVVYDNA